MTRVALHVIGRLESKAYKTLHLTSEQLALPTSLKSPTRGIWFLRVFPITEPVFEMTTAVFQITPLSSLSMIGDTITMLYFLASFAIRKLCFVIKKTILKF
jgi:hypothetical protein